MEEEWILADPEPVRDPMRDSYLKGFEDAREMAAKEVDEMSVQRSGFKSSIAAGALAQLSSVIRAMKPKEGE